MKAWNKLLILSIFLLLTSCGVLSKDEETNPDQTLTPQAAGDCNVPADVFDLTNWKLTLPIAEGSSPKEVKQPELATYSVNPYFLLNGTCDGVVFRAPVNGYTTSGSSYPRSELREMKSNGTELAAWDFNSGIHTMFIDQAITAVPVQKRHIVVGQIHDANDDVIVIRLEYPKLFIDINGDDGPTLDPNYTLGKRFTVKFVAGNGKVDIFYNGGVTPAYTLIKNSTANYFKAGAYTQSNCSRESSCTDSNYGQVVIYQLSVTHGDSPPPTVNGTFEAEAGKVIAPMQKVTDPTASGGSYVTQPQAGVEGRIEYTVTVPTTGIYTLRSRVIASAGDRNSIFYGLDTSVKTILNYPDNLTAWTWVDGPKVSLSAGTHTFTVWNRERGTKLDAFALVPVSSATGIFQAESGNVVSPMVIVSDALAQGGAYVVQTATSGQGSVTYSVTVPATGKYTLRSRIIASAGDRNSIYYAFNAASKTTLAYPDNITSWSWVNGPVVSLTAGTHQLTIWNRERNTKLDAFELVATN